MKPEATTSIVQTTWQTQQHTTWCSDDHGYAVTQTILVVLLDTAIRQDLLQYLLLKRKPFLTIDRLIKHGWQDFRRMHGVEFDITKNANQFFMCHLCDLLCVYMVNVLECSSIYEHILDVVLCCVFSMEKCLRSKVPLIHYVFRYHATR